jgi:hypothetical protein
MDSHLISSTKEEKVILEKFLAVLFCIHPSTLLGIFSDEIPTALGHAPQLRRTFPTLIQQYEQTEDEQTKNEQTKNDQTISSEAAVEIPQDTKETAAL